MAYVPGIDHLTVLVPGAFAAGGGFAFFRWIIDRISVRVNKREDRVDAAGDKLFGNALDFANSIQTAFKSQQTRLDAVEEHLAECRAHHSQCTAEVAQLRAQMEGFGIARQQAANAMAADVLAKRAGA